jgi:hypothetical protein
MVQDWLPKEEYIALHKEVEGCMAELGLMERASVLGLAAIFAWVATHAETLNGYAGLAWWAPLPVAAFGAWKSYAIAHHINVLGSYLTLLECEAEEPRLTEVSKDRLDAYERASFPQSRWQVHLMRKSEGWRTRVTRIAWVVLVVATGVGSLFGFQSHKERCPGPGFTNCAQVGQPKPPTQ